MFERGSRYEGVPDRETVLPDGRRVAHMALRIVPAPEGRLPLPVRPDDRFDTLAHRAYGDPQQFWRLCDAARVLRPEEIAAAPGRVLRVPVPDR